MVRRITLKTRAFAKAGDAMAFFSDMLNRYTLNDRVNESDSADLLALLVRHEDAAEKIGAGVDHFEVRNAPDGYRGRCFWIVRTEGEPIDFSLKHCLEARPGD